MSNLIRSRKAVTTAPRLIPTAPPLAAIAPAKMDHMPIDPIGTGVAQAPASSVALPVSARRGHCSPHKPDTPSASTTDV